MKKVMLLFIALAVLPLVSAQNWVNTTDTNLGIFSATAVVSSQFGMVIEANGNSTLVEIIKDASCQQTVAYLTDNIGTLLAQSSFVGDIATFNYNIADGVRYRVLGDNNGSLYLVSYATFGIRPENDTNIDWIEGYDTAGFYYCISAMKTAKLISSPSPSPSPSSSPSVIYNILHASGVGISSFIMAIVPSIFIFLIIMVVVAGLVGIVVVVSQKIKTMFKK